MKSLGYTNGDVNQLVVRETGILAVIATMIGLPLGVGLGSFIQHLLMSAVASQNVVYELELVKPLLLSAIVGIVFPFIAAAFPIIQAGKTPILEAMFEKDANKSMRHKLSTLRIVLGILCTVIGLMDHLFALFILFVGLVLLYPLWIELVEKIIHPVFKVVFHFPGKLAIRSIKQFKNRNANTSAMLAIGVSLTLFMSALLDSLPEGMEEEIRRTYGGDILVTKETPWTDEELAFIKSIEEVDTVHTFADIPNITWKTIDGEYREFSIMSFSDELKTKFYMKEESNINSELPALYLGERALSEWGGKLGETITLNTPAGKVNFFVKGIVETSHYTNYVAFVSENELENILNWPAHFQLAISVQDEKDIHIVNSQLWQTFGDSISKLDSVIFEIEKTRNSLENMRELMHGLLILVIALSAIGISNTMFMNTIERIKEIGTMRAVGLTKGQVKLMIIAEGLVIGVSGVIIGTLYGILIIFLNTQSEKLQSLISFSVPWFSLILAISSGIVFTLIASWLPSITASKVPVKEAINYE